MAYGDGAEEDDEINAAEDQQPGYAAPAAVAPAGPGGALGAYQPRTAQGAAVLARVQAARGGAKAAPFEVAQGAKPFSIAAPPEPPQQGLLKDTGDQVWAATLGMGKDALGLASFATKQLTGDPHAGAWLDNQKASIQAHIDATTAGESKAGQAASRASVFNSGDDPNAPTWGQAGYARTAVATAASFVPDLVAAIVPASIGARIGLRLARMAELSDAGAATAGRVAGHVATGATFGGIDAGAAWNTITEQVDKATPEEMAQNPTYQHLRDSGLSDQDAKAQLLSSPAVAASVMAHFAVGGVAGAAGGSLLRSGALGAGERGVLGRAGIGAAEGAGLMGGQAGIENPIDQATGQSVGTHGDFDAHALAQAVASGALGGAVMGGVGGALHASHEPTRMPGKDVPTVAPDIAAALQGELDLGQAPPGQTATSGAQGEMFRTIGEANPNPNTPPPASALPPRAPPPPPGPPPGPAQQVMGFRQPPPAADPNTAAGPGAQGELFRDQTGATQPARVENSATLPAANVSTTAEIPPVSAPIPVETPPKAALAPKPTPAPKPATPTTRVGLIKALIEAGEDPSPLRRMKIDDLQRRFAASYPAETPGDPGLTNETVVNNTGVASAVEPPAGVLTSSVEPAPASPPVEVPTASPEPAGVAAPEAPPEPAAVAEKVPEPTPVVEPAPAPAPAKVLTRTEQLQAQLAARRAAAKAKMAPAAERPIATGAHVADEVKTEVPPKDVVADKTPFDPAATATKVRDAAGRAARMESLPPAIVEGWVRDVTRIIQGTHSEDEAHAALAEWGAQKAPITGAKVQRAVVADKMMRLLTGKGLASRDAINREIGRDARVDRSVQENAGVAAKAELESASAREQDAARQEATDQGGSTTVGETEGHEGEEASQGVVDHSAGGEKVRSADTTDMRRKLSDLEHKIRNEGMTIAEADAAYGKQEGAGRRRTYPDVASWIRERIANEEEPTTKAHLVEALAKHEDPVGTALKAEQQRIAAEAAKAAPAKAAPAKPSAEVPQWALDHAHALAGEVVYHDGDIALIRGHAVLSGKPVYVGATRAARTISDISQFTGADFLPIDQLRKLRAEKSKLEAADKAAHEARPNGPFTSGRITASAGVDPRLADLAHRLTDMVGLGHTRIFLTDAAEMAKPSATETYGLHGPFAAVRSAALQEGGGSVRRLANGDYHITLSPRVRVSAQLETLAHEIGHILQREAYDTASATEKTLIQNAYSAWIKANDIKNAGDYVRSLRAHTVGKLTKVETPDVWAYKLPPYWRSFNEWFADQVSRWATTDARPLSILDRFFARIADGYRRLTAAFGGDRYKADPVMRDWLNARGEDAHPIEVRPTAPDTAAGFSAEGAQHMRDTTRDLPTDPVLRAQAEPLSRVASGALGRAGDEMRSRINLSSVGDWARSKVLAATNLDQIVTRYHDLFTPSDRLDIGSNPLTRVRDASEKVAHRQHEFTKQFGDSASALVSRARALDPAEYQSLGRLLNDATIAEAALGTTEAKANEHLKTPERQAELRALQARYAQLSPEAKAVHRGVVDFYHDTNVQDRRAELNGVLSRAFPDATEAQRDAFARTGMSKDGFEKFLADPDNSAIAAAHGADWGQQRALAVGMAKLLQVGRVRGDYTSLGRFGDYVLKYGEKGTKDFGFEMFERKGDAIARRAQLLAEGALDVEHVDLKKTNALREITRDHPLINEVEKALQGHPDLAEHASDVRDIMNKIVLQSATRSDVSRARRKGIQGASTDFARVLSKDFINTAGRIGYLEHGAERFKALSHMDLVAQDLARRGEEGQGIQARQVLHELQMKVTTQESAGGVLARASRVASAFGYTQSLMSFSHIITNSLEAHMNSVPMLGARHNPGRVAIALGKAMADVAPTMIKAGARNTMAALGKGLKAANWDLSAAVRDRLLAKAAPGDRAGITQLFQALDQAGIVDHSETRELRRIAHGGGPFSSTVGRKAQGVWDKFTDFMGVANHAVDVLNKSAIAKAAYDLELHKSAGNVDQAVAYAVQMVRDTSPNYNLANKNRFSTSAGVLGGAAGPLTQFKQYGFHMYGVLGNLVKASLAGATKDEKIQARKAFAGVLTTHAMMAGGLTLIADPLRYIGGLYDYFAGAGAPHDYQNNVRSWMADTFGPTMAEIMARGLPHAVGLDLHRRIGLDNLLAIPALESFDSKGAIKMLGTAALGAAGEDAATAMDGVSKVMRGDMGGFLAIVPRPVRDVMKAVNLSNHGVTDSTGKPILAPERISAGGIAAQAFGIQPSQVSEVREGRNAVLQKETEIKYERTQLAQAWLKADPADRAAVWQQIQVFNQDNHGMAITRDQLVKQQHANAKQANAPFGLRLPPKASRSLAEAGAFANVQ